MIHSCFDVFKTKDLEFIEETHQYFLKGKELLPVSDYIDEYVLPFDREFWGMIKAKQNKISKQEMLKQWDDNLELKCKRGTNVHFWNQCYLKWLMNVIPSYPAKPFDDIEKLCVDNFLDLYNSRLNKLELVEVELTLFSEELGIAGTPDVIFYDKELMLYVIGDWKTNDEMTDDHSECRNYLKPPFHNEKENYFNKYSMQLSMYSLLLEMHGIFTVNNFLGHLNNKNGGRIIFIKDYKQIFKMIFGII